MRKLTTMVNKMRNNIYYVKLSVNEFHSSFRLLPCHFPALAFDLHVQKASVTGKPYIMDVFYPQAALF
jgi:hypothetical protein